MIAIVALGLLAMSACLILQAVALVVAVRYFDWAAKRPHGGHTMWSSFVRLSVLMSALMVGNIVQIAIWAAIYRALGGFEDFETALYFSGVTFATVGYGDELLHGRVRLLAPLQGANGVMMFGLSSATLYAALQRIVGAWVNERPKAPHAG